MTLISVILLKMFLTKLDSENIIVMSPSPGTIHNCLSIHRWCVMAMLENANH